MIDFFGGVGGLVMIEKDPERRHLKKTRWPGRLQGLANFVGVAVDVVLSQSGLEAVRNP